MKPTCTPADFNLCPFIHGYAHFKIDLEPPRPIFSAADFEIFR
jgi:hypothetical protein